MTKEIPLVWLAASGCTGCSVSLLNSASPSIKNVLVDEIVPGVHIMAIGWEKKVPQIIDAAGL